MGLRGFGGSFLPILDVLLPALLGITFVGIMVMTFILIVTRFDRNLLGDEGYLMFTLPAKTSTLITAKLLTAILWLFGTFLVFLLSIT
nr:ABC transporter permease [Proteiniclasticum sp.]